MIEFLFMKNILPTKIGIITSPKNNLFLLVVHFIFVFVNKFDIGIVISFRGNLL